MTDVIKRLQAATPDRADLVPLWVTSGAECVVSDGKYKPEIGCVFRDYTSWSIEDTHVTADMAGERGDDLDTVTFRHVAMLDDKYAGWAIVERPKNQLGFETKSECDEWLASHLRHEYEWRSKQLDEMPGKVRPVLDRDAKKPGVAHSAWPVAKLNGWFKFVWHRKLQGWRARKNSRPRVRQTRAPLHCGVR